jgi:hypothetical protein
MTGTTAGRTGLLHHVELWVPDLGRAMASWGWLLAQLGYARFQEFAGGISWRLGDTYVVARAVPRADHPNPHTTQRLAPAVFTRAPIRLSQ